MFKKTKTTPHSLLNDESRRAEAQKKINRTVATYVVFKVGVTAALVIGAKILAKKLEESTPSED